MEKTVEQLVEEVRRFNYSLCAECPELKDCPLQERGSMICPGEVNRFLTIFLDQTKDDCFNCNGTGKCLPSVYHDPPADCPLCKGTGKVGNWHPERLVVLDEDQKFPPNPYGARTNQEVYQRAIDDSHRANFRRIKVPSRHG